MPVNVIVSQESRRWAHELDDSIQRWLARHAPDYAFKSPNRGELRHITNERLAEILSDEHIEYAALISLQNEAVAINDDLVRRSKELADSGANHRTLSNLKRQRGVIGQKINMLNMELHKRRQLVKKDNGTTFRSLPHYFMDVVADEFPDEFARLKRMAQERRDADIGL